LCERLITEQYYVDETIGIPLQDFFKGT